MGLSLIKAAESEEHLQRHADSGSLTIGSKALPGLQKAEVAQMLETFDEAYAALIAQEGNPGRREFCLRCGHSVGTDAVAAKADLKKGTKIVPVTRDIGTPYETEVQVVLIDMPQTDLVYGIYGPYGPTGKAGIYTMVYGDPSRPFPKKLEADADERAKAQNAVSEKYWRDHVFLCTPDEMRAAIAQMSAAGKDVSRQTAALLSFQTKGNASPLNRQEMRQPLKGAILLSAPEQKEQRGTGRQNRNGQEAVLRARIQRESR